MSRIEYAMNKEQAEALFAEHAVMMGERDVIFDYVVADLFGPEACVWAESCMGSDHYLELGPDWGSWGSCGCHYFKRSGFMKLVSWHNYHICLAEYQASEGGKIWDGLWQARQERLDAADAEEERKREERRAKRAAARKAKQEAKCDGEAVKV